MRVGASIAGARSLWRTGGDLGLSAIGRVKYALSWYLHHDLLSPLAPSHFVVKLPGGMLAVIRPNGVDCHTLKDIFWGRIYESGTDGVKRVLDLGANIGLASLFFASKCPDAEFACVEPFPGNRVVLKEAIRLNHIQAVVFEGAVGTTAGTGELHIGCEPDMFSMTPAVKSAETLRVRTFSVPEILSAMRWDGIDLLKIDIEGYEKTLLSQDNDWLKLVKTIIGEAHGHADYGISDVKAHLEPFGFHVTQKSFDPGSGLTVFEARRQ